MPRRKYRSKIKFEMSGLSEITDQLIIVNRNFYTKPVVKHQSSIRFAVPKELIYDLDLKAGDKCYFLPYADGYYISFKEKPYESRKIRERNLIKAGAYDTLYLVIPPIIRNLYQEPIKAVQLMHIEGFPSTQWHFKPLFINFTYENN